MKGPEQSASLDVAGLFLELERRGVRYAVLRNYECLPVVRRDDDSGVATDIDLVVDSADLPLWREAAASFAKQGGWHALTECDHWTQSGAREHHVEVFRFYRFSPPEFLEVDLFHGYFVWGVPLFDEQRLLAGNGRDRKSTRLNSSHIQKSRMPSSA